MLALRITARPLTPKVINISTTRRSLNTSSAMAAAEVKRLGVVGAGQMVGAYRPDCKVSEDMETDSIDARD